MSTPLEGASRLSERLAALGLRADAPFAQPELIAEALTHGSYTRERGGRSNQRLEMLGDAVLGFVVAELLFHLFPEAQEGALTQLRASLVDEASLARQARRLDLGGLLGMGRGEENSGGRERDAALADAFEAIVAAVYLSEGLPALRVLVEKLFREEAVTRSAQAPQPDDYKTALQEKVQAVWKVQPSYRIVSATGKDHERQFVAEVWIGDQQAGQGEGRTKKLAEQQAARAALENWDEIARRHGVPVG